MGRPRSFDKAVVLTTMMDLFWNRGFDGVSMHALVGETGVKKASLYAAFGNKQQMYLAALDRYIEQEVGFAVDLLTVTSRDGGEKAIAGLFAGVLEEVEAGSGRWGCFLCNASIDRAPFDQETSRRVGLAYKAFEDAFDAALEKTQAFGNRSKVRRKQAHALLATYFGMRVMARSGMAAADLAAVRDQAMLELA